MKKKKFFYLLFKILLVSLCLTYIIWDLDFHNLSAVLVGLDLFPILNTLAASLLIYAAMSLRLNYLTSWSAGSVLSFKATILCLGLNNILPARLGEIAKIVYLRKKAALPYDRGLSLTFWERFADLNFILLACLLLLYGLKFDFSFSLLACAVLFIWASLFFFRFRPKYQELLLRYFSFSLVKNTLQNTLSQILSKSTKPRFLAMIFFLTMIIWSLFIVVMYLMINWVCGLDLSVKAVIAVYVLTTLAWTVPSAPSALGVFEASMVLSMGWFGVGKEEALMTALLFRIFFNVPYTVWALLIAAGSGLDLKTIGRKEAGTF